MPELQDRVSEFSNMLLLSNGTLLMSHFRAILCFAVFEHFYVSEYKYSLCFQIRKIPFVFLPINHRLLLTILKVVAVSGAGRLSPSDTGAVMAS